MSTGADEPPEATEELLLLAAYLLSSSRGLLEEPAGYGPLRCLDAARRVLALRASLGGEEGADLAAVRERLDGVMCGAMADRDLSTLLDEACDRLATATEEPGAVTA